MAVLRLLRKKIPAWVVLFLVVIISLAQFIPSLFQQNNDDITDVKEYVRRLMTQATLSVNQCSNFKPCSQETVSFHINSGKMNILKPKICFDGSYEHFPESLMGRGLNLLVVNASSKEPYEKVTFDIYQDGDSSFYSYLQSLKETDLVLFVTFDDAFHQLSDNSKAYLIEHFGSHHIKKLGYRSSWAFVGQKGVKHRADFELLNPPINGDWAETAEIKGCLSIPLNESAPTKAVPIQADTAVMKSSEEPLCGLDHVCQPSQSAVRVSSSAFINRQKYPSSFCINGEIEINVKGQIQVLTGRGVNLVVFNPFKKRVVKTGSFDTYHSGEESNKLVEFLDDVNATFLVFGTVSDEASNSLSTDAKEILGYFGGVKFKDLAYRDVWSFVGQMGINGSTALEVFNRAKDGMWGDRAEIKQCIPAKFKGAKTIRNLKDRRRLRFCEKYDGYEELCSVNKPMNFETIPLDDMSLYRNPAYNMPIVIIPGSDLTALQRCMHSLLAIPGLQKEQVFVVLEGHFSEPTDLVSLYGFQIREIVSKPEYTENFLRALEVALSVNSNLPYAIILEQFLEVSPDFLRYFSQTIHLLDKDTSLFTISAWNDNGFSQSSGDSQVFYRSEGFPGFGWVLQRRLWKDISNQNFACCRNPTWRTWFKGGLRNRMEAVVPDLSRVKRTLAPGIYEEKLFLRPFLENRIHSRVFTAEPTNTYLLSSQEYEQEVARLIQKSQPFDASLLEACIQQNAQLPQGLSTIQSAIYSVFYHQSSASDETLLRRLGSCFGLFVHEESTMRNVHKGLLRFTRNGSQFLLIGSESPYFPHRPEKVPVIK